MLKKTEFEVPAPRVVKIIKAFDPARPSPEQWKEWLGDKYDEEKDRVLITDHPETRAGYMFNKLYNLSASNLDKIIPTWTYGKWSNYNLTIVDDVYNDTDHVRPPADGPVPNTQGVYFAHPKDPNTTDREAVRIYHPEWGNRFENSEKFPLVQDDVEYIDIDLRRFWPAGRPYSDGVTTNQVGPGGSDAWHFVEQDDCNNALEVLIQGQADWQAILDGASPYSNSVWAAGFTSRNPNTSFNQTVGAWPWNDHDHPHEKLFYATGRLSAGSNFDKRAFWESYAHGVRGTVPGWADFAFGPLQWWPLMTPAPNKGAPGERGNCSRYDYTADQWGATWGALESMDACSPPMFELEPEAHVWTAAGGPDLKIFEWDWAEKIIGTDDGFGAFYGEFKDRWRYDIYGERYTNAGGHPSNTAWCAPVYGAGSWVDAWCNTTLPDWWCGEWYSLHDSEPCDWTGNPNLCSYGISIDLTEDVAPWNYLPGTPSSLYGVTNREYDMMVADTNASCVTQPTSTVISCWTHVGGSVNEIYDTRDAKGVNDEVWRAGEKYYVGGYWTANYGWPLHLANSVDWDSFPHHAGGAPLGPIAGGIMNYWHMEGDAVACQQNYAGDPAGYVCKDIHEFPPEMRHPNWTKSALQNTAPYNRYLDWTTENDELDEYRQPEMSQILICETLEEDEDARRIFPVLKPIELGIYDNKSERVCPEYLEGDLLYVTWDQNAGGIIEMLTALGFEINHNGEQGMFVDTNVDKRKKFDYSNVEGIKIYKDVFPEPYIPMETTFLIPSGTPLNAHAGHGDAYSFNCYPPSLMHMDREDSVVVCESPCSTVPRSYPANSAANRGAAGDKGESAGNKEKGDDGDVGEKNGDDHQGAEGAGGPKGNKGQKGDQNDGEKGIDGSKGYKASSTYDWKFTSLDATIGSAAPSTRLDGSTVTLGNNQIAKGNIKGRLGSTANLTAGESSETDTFRSIVFEPKKLGICAEDDVAPNEKQPKYLYFTTFVSEEIIDYTE